MYGGLDYFLNLNYLTLSRIFLYVSRRQIRFLDVLSEHLDTRKWKTLQS